MFIPSFIQRHRNFSNLQTKTAQGEDLEMLGKHQRACFSCEFLKMLINISEGGLLQSCLSLKILPSLVDVHHPLAIISPKVSYGKILRSFGKQLSEKNSEVKTWKLRLVAFDLSLRTGRFSSGLNGRLFRALTRSISPPPLFLLLSLLTSKGLIVECLPRVEHLPNL